MGYEWAAALVAAGFVAAISNATLGIGGALMVMPLLSLWFPPRMVVGYTIPMFFASTLVIGWRYRRQIDRRFLYWLVPGVVVGIAFGTHFLRSAAPDLVRWVMGGIAVLFVSFEVVRLAARRPFAVLPFWTGILFSVASGLASAMANLGGTIMSLSLLGRDLEPAVFVGTLNAIEVAMGAEKLALFYGTGLVTPLGLLLALPSIPAIMVGSSVGQYFNRRLPARTFRWIFVGIIALSAILLLLGY